MAKIAVIKEEFVRLTGDFMKALVLNQMIYWSERMGDTDRYIQEEKARAEKFTGESPDFGLSHGWIYKKAEELVDELMVGIHQTTMAKHLNSLVESGWLDRRRNPKYKIDKTYQYRVNLLKVQQDLDKLGYTLRGKKSDLPDLLPSKPETYSDKPETYRVSGELIEQAENLSDKRETLAIPEITSEITSEITDKQQQQNLLSEVSVEEQEKEKRVVVVRNKIRSLFNNKKAITKKQVQEILELCEAEDASWEHMVRNVYEYHTDPNTEPIRSLHRALIHAIENKIDRETGGWQLTKKQDLLDTLPRAARRTYTPRHGSEEELAAHQAIVKEKLREMGEKLSLR
jgi:DNA-binding MarR family transcriptional regulator